MKLIAFLSIALALCALPRDARANGSGIMQIGRFESQAVALANSYGSRVEIDGDTAVVASPGEGSGGVVYVYRRTGPLWEQEARLEATFGGTTYSRAIDLSGDTLAIGGADASGRTVFVFTRTGTQWTEQDRLYTQFVGGGSLFAYQVAVSGDTIAVSSKPACEIGCTGGIEVFDRAGSAWTRTAGWLSSAVPFFTSFYRDLDLDGDVLVVGNNFDDFAVVNRRGATSWNVEAMLSPTVGGWSLFGTSVAVAGELVIVGAPQHTAQGAIYAFRHDNGQWPLEEILQTSVVPAGKIGEAIDVTDLPTTDYFAETVIAGNPWRSGQFANDGAVHLFRAAGPPFWEEIAELEHGDPQPSDRFGHSVAISGTNMFATTAGSGSSGQSVRQIAYPFGFEVQQTAGGYCFGDGTSIACPCGNESELGACKGCASSTGGSHLGVFGYSATSDDQLVFVASGLPPGQPALLIFGGPTQHTGATPFPFGDGLLCLEPPIVRLTVKTADPYGLADWGPGLQAIGGWGPGEVGGFQVWHRDPTGPCGAGFNLSNAVMVFLSL